MRASNRKWLIILVLVITLAAVGGFTFYNSAKKVDYITAKIDRGDIDSVISATGTCNAVINVQVGSQVSGNILELHADWNSKVTKGENGGHCPGSATPATACALRGGMRHQAQPQSCSAIITAKAS